MYHYIALLNKQLCVYDDDDDDDDDDSNYLFYCDF